MRLLLRRGLLQGALVRPRRLVRLERVGVGEGVIRADGGFERGAGAAEGALARLRLRDPFGAAFGLDGQKNHSLEAVHYYHKLLKE